MTDEPAPQPTPDYPRTIREFDAMFATEELCRSYLARLRWADAFKCPKCGGPDAWLTARGQMHCKACQRPTSPTAGTILQVTRTPLRVWFQAMWWVTSQKNGASALGLQRILGLKSYETAWAWLHKLRRAMVRPGRDQLTGAVEVDETYVGGVSKSKDWHSDKSEVAIAAEIRGSQIGRIRLQCLGGPECRSVNAFVRIAVAPGSTIVTDGRQDYKFVKDGYVHDRRPIGWDRSNAHRLLPRVHRVASLLKRWLLGTHHGRVERQHLQYYLDEYTFRFNRRASRHRGWLFYRLLQQVVDVEPVTLAELIGGTDRRRSV